VSVRTEASAVRERFSLESLMPYYFAARRTLGESLRQRRGHTLALLAMLLMPALGFVAVSMDLGIVYAMRARLQLAADAAVLAGAQEFITGGSVETYVTSYLAKNPIGENPATIEQLVVNTDSGLVQLTIGYQTAPLFLAPQGVGLRVRAGARAQLTKPAEKGRPVPPGNAYGWYKKDKSSPGKDSALVRLTS
jgi:Flp pilus assembly protein TadG